MMQEHIFDIWDGKIMNQYRKDLIHGKRVKSPCTMCNAEGTILGKNMQTHGNKYIDKNI